MSLNEILMAAVRRGSLADARSILETDRADINAVDRWGLTPLMQAVTQDDREMVELLLSMGADPRLVTATGVSAIGMASPAVREILEAGPAPITEQAPSPAPEKPETAPASALKRLLKRYDDTQALAKLAAAGQAVVPVLRRAYAGLEHDDWMTAQWYNRILALVAPDPVGEALSLTDQVDKRHCAELAWVLRRFVSPQDAARLRESLASMLSVNEAEQLVWALPRLAVFCEALGLAGAEEDMPQLRRVLDLALEELERLRKAEALHLCGPEVAPAAAACASALLSISERHGLETDHERDEWRRVCLDLARSEGYHASYAIGGLMVSPMPLLFARAPQECSRFLASLSQVGAEGDTLLSDIYYWLTTAQEQGVIPDLGQRDEGMPDWLDTLERRAPPGEHKRKESLDLRALVRPASALAYAMEDLAGPWLDVSAIAHSVSILRQTTPLAEMAAVAVESAFVQRSAGREDGVKATRELNRDLKEDGLSPIAGWTWLAPPGRLSPGSTPQDLHATLCAAARYSLAAAAAPEVAAEQLAPLQDRLSHPLVRHACYRTLLAALRDVPAEAIGACLALLRAEADPAMARAVLRMAQGMVRRHIGQVLLLLLDAPAVHGDAGLCEEVVLAVSAAAPPGAGERLLAFGRELGWGTPSRGSYGVSLALAVAMGRLGVRGAAPLLAGLVGTSGLGSEIEVALLRLAARHPGIVDDVTFARAFERVAGDEYAKLDGSLVGNQACALVLRTLGESPLGSPGLAHACRFLAETSKAESPPPRALPMLMRLLPRALAEAQAHPGEAWEDRNWGGYNASPEEDLAEIMTRAVEALCDGTYSREGWCALLDDFLDLPDLEETLVATTAQSSVTGIRFAARNVFAALARNLSRLKEPAVDEALALSPPTAALRAARVALVRDVARQRTSVSRKTAEKASADERE